jgi:hypothetical protein
VASTADGAEPTGPEPTSPGPLSTSYASSSSSDSRPGQSRITHRPPRFPTKAEKKSGSFANDGDDEEEEENEPAFLLHQPPKDDPDSGAGGPYDMGATLRGTAGDPPRKLLAKYGKIHYSQTSDSSASSTAVVTKRAAAAKKPSGPLSPRRTAELSGRRSSGKGKGLLAKDSSDGTPSMSSSFSDLDGMLFEPW